MPRASLAALGAAIIVTFFLTNGCAPPALPPAAEILAGLNAVILDPGRSCEEMRSHFGLENLPLANNPADLGIAYEEFELSTPAGEVLRTWYVPAPRERGVIVVSNGSTGAMQCYLHGVWLLTQMGWTVVTYDYTGFGGSSGVASLDTLIPDLETVVAWALVHTGQSQVTLLGVSLGTMPSVAVAVRYPERVNAVVLDSPVALGDEIERYGGLLRLPVVEIIRAVDPALISENTIAALDQPLLMFVHGRDRVTPPGPARKIYERAPGPKELVEFPGLSHGMGQYLATEQYVNGIEPFLARVWEVPAIAWRYVPAETTTR